MVGSAARMVWKQPFMLRVTISSNSSGVVCTPVLPIGPEPPATLTRTSMRPPKASLVAATADSHCLGSVRSQGITIALAPPAFTSSATGAIAAVSRPISASLQPSAAKAWVIEAPMPLAGPVISTTRSSSESFMVLSSVIASLLQGWECWAPLRSSHPCLDGGWPLAGGRHEAAIEHLADGGLARQLLRRNQDVDRLGHPFFADVA